MTGYLRFVVIRWRKDIVDVEQFQRAVVVVVVIVVLGLVVLSVVFRCLQGLLLVELEVLQQRVAPSVFDIIDVEIVNPRIVGVGLDIRLLPFTRANELSFRG